MEETIISIALLRTAERKPQPLPNDEERARPTFDEQLSAHFREYERRAREILVDWPMPHPDAVKHLTAALMRAANDGAAEARREERERCAKLHDECARDLRQRAADSVDPEEKAECERCANVHRNSAAAIRALEDE